MPDAYQLREQIFSSVPGLSISETLFESLTDIVFCVKDRSSRYVAVNMAFVRGLRLPNKEAAIGRTARDFFPPALAATFERQDEIVFSSNREIKGVLELNINSDGSTGWYLAQKIPLHNARHEVIALAGTSLNLKTASRNDPKLNALAVIIAEIQRDYAQPLRMEDLARKAQMPLVQMERTMRSILGLTPRQLLTKARIDAAAIAIRTSRANLCEIAMQCGFYDQAVFSRQFRAATGLTPRQYRETHERSAR